MATKRDIEIDSMLNEIDVYVKRAKVLTEDVQQSYFGESITSMDDVWRVMSPYYNHAGVKIDIINAILFDLNKLVDGLRDFISQEEGEALVSED